MFNMWLNSTVVEFRPLEKWHYYKKIEGDGEPDNFSFTICQRLPIFQFKLQNVILFQLHFIVAHVHFECFADDGYFTFFV